MREAMDFPRQPLNPDKARPALFGCVFGPAPVEPGQRPDVLACAFGIDPDTVRPQRSWAEEWGDAMHLCNWRGGRVDGGPMDDFVVFGAGAEGWFEKSGEGQMSRPMSRAMAMAEAGMDFLSLRYGVPRGKFSSLAWIVRRPSGLAGDTGMWTACQAQEQACRAKRMILASWEAAQLGLSAGEGEAAQQRRL